MADRDLPVVDMRWLTDGEEDPHDRYITLTREELAGAFISDDELANRASFLSTISQEKDTADMIHSHRTGGDYICKSVVGEIIKERLRWLSRRVAILEGRYPGVDANLQPVIKEAVVNPAEVIAEVRMIDHLPRLCDSLYFKNSNRQSKLAELAKQRGLSAKFINLSIIFGHYPNIEHEKRWHLYVQLVRDLLKNHKTYVPFIDDKFSFDEKAFTITINESKYFSKGTYKIAEPIAAVRFPEFATIRKLDLLFDSLQGILDIWYDGEGDSWGSNWTDGKFTAKELLNELQLAATTTDPEHVIKREPTDPRTNVFNNFIEAYIYGSPKYDASQSEETKIRLEVSSIVSNLLIKG